MDEIEEESDDQEEEEWSSYPCLPPNKTNSLTHILFDCPPCLPKEDECYIYNCDDPIDSFEISFFDEIDTTILELDMDCVLVDHEKHALCDTYIVELFMMLLKIIMRKENMVVGIFMLLKHLSLH